MKSILAVLVSIYIGMGIWGASAREHPIQQQIAVKKVKTLLILADK